MAPTSKVPKPMPRLQVAARALVALNVVLWAVAAALLLKDIVTLAFGSTEARCTVQFCGLMWTQRPPRTALQRLRCEHAHTAVAHTLGKS